MPGLLISGRTYEVPGLEIVSHGEKPWAELGKGRSMDGHPRIGPPQMAIIHKTIADDPERVLDGKGKLGGPQSVAEMWDKDPKYSGAHIVTGRAGESACMEDLALFTAYHASQRYVNERSYGHEIKEDVGGTVRRPALEACVTINLFATEKLGIQQQVPRAYTDNKPIRRLQSGGTNVRGIFGHRDVTTDRNRWDPGDIVFAMFRARGCESFDFEAGEDLEVWAKRQGWMRELGYYHGAIDGDPGPKTTAALAALGYPSGIFALWRRCIERPPMPPGFNP